jgi:2-keto-3-deoxy-L-fuconate dehydrogenase
MRLPLGWSLDWLPPSLEGRIATLTASSGDPIEKVRQAFVDRQPIGRLGKAEESAAIAVDLAPTQIKSL